MFNTTQCTPFFSASESFEQKKELITLKFKEIKQNLSGGRTNNLDRNLNDVERSKNNYIRSSYHDLRGIFGLKLFPHFCQSPQPTYDLISLVLRALLAELFEAGDCVQQASVAFLELAQLNLKCPIYFLKIVAKDKPEDWHYFVAVGEIDFDKLTIDKNTMIVDPWSSLCISVKEQSWFEKAVIEKRISSDVTLSTGEFSQDQINVIRLCLTILRQNSESVIKTYVEKLMEQSTIYYVEDLKKTHIETRHGKNSFELIKKHCPNLFKQECTKLKEQIFLKLLNKFLQTIDYKINNRCLVEDHCEEKIKNKATF